MRVVIAEDQVLLRAGLGRLFAEGRHDVVTPVGFGYLLKDRVLDVSDFLAAAERVARGGSALDPHVVATLLSGRRSDDPLAGLTDRERTVLQLMAEGLTNTGIAKRLHLSERTVEAHVRHLLTKLDMPDSEDDHRRVHAVLAHLSATQPLHVPRTSRPARTASLR